jgi:hypothetical protein
LYFQKQLLTTDIDIADLYSEDIPFYLDAVVFDDIAVASAEE